MSRVRALPPIGRILVVAALSLLGACDRTPTEPAQPKATSSLFGPTSPELVECPTDETKFKTVDILDATIENLVSLDGHSVLFPPNALPGPTTVTLTVPASRYVEITIHAEGVDYFPVVKPIVTISYARCNRFDVLLKPLTAWYIDSETKELLEKMLSVDNKLTRSVTFPTNHFSGYAVAF
jgi:hypothetical protein